MKEKIERIDVRSIKDPNVVKKLGYKSLAVLCHDIRTEIIHETSLYGGHLSSNLGVVELTVALYRSFDFPKDKLIFDVGHQCYTHKILTGRSLDHLNEKGYCAGFEKRDESVYDCYEAGHSGTALSAAEGFALARDLRKEKYEVVAVVGDASVVNGLAFEALNNISNRNNKIIAVLNDNNMSISRPVGGLGNFFRHISTDRIYNKFKNRYRHVLYRTAAGRKLYQFSYAIKSHIKAALVPTTMFDNMGFTYIGPVDGHNIRALEKAFRKAKTTTKSAIVHVYTTKGKGYDYAAQDEIGYWHGVTPFDVKTGKPLSMHEGQRSWSHYMGDFTEEMLASHSEATLIVPAMIRGSGLDDCFAHYPERCFDVGIAEEHAVTMAGALSLNGYHPILVIYSTFLQRAYDELQHDVARMNCELTLLIDRAGLVGHNGSTHQGIYDEAYLSSIPGVTIAQPATLAEAKGLYNLAFSGNRGIFAIRYPHVLTNIIEPIEPLKLDFQKARPIVGNPQAKVAFVGVGPMGQSVYESLAALQKNVAYLNPLFLHPLDEEAFKGLLSFPIVYLYDPYGTENAFVAEAALKLYQLGYQGKIIIRAIPNVFVEHASTSDQLSEFRLSMPLVIQEISALL
jgi:1-deoxy-D-xylulose-5-phosphate synthase